MLTHEINSENDMPRKGLYFVGIYHSAFLNPSTKRAVFG